MTRNIAKRLVVSCALYVSSVAVVAEPTKTNDPISDKTKAVPALALAKNTTLETPSSATKSKDEVTKNNTAKAPAKKAVKRKRYISCMSFSKTRLNKRAQPYLSSIQKYAKKYQVDANLIKSVIAAESCYNRTAVSPKNAQGLMQLIPATASRFGVTDSFNADQNIKGGTRYLRFLLRRFKGDMTKVIASYNAGEGAVDRYKGIPPYRETQQYVKNVFKVYGKLTGNRQLAQMDFNKAFPLSAPLSSTSTGKGVKATPFLYNKNGRVSTQYSSPFAGSGGKPGRSGLTVNKLRAPHLYKQE
ncbi:MAG: lytic transglycosylase domain-containing protein [bacterium]